MGTENKNPIFSVIVCCYNPEFDKLKNTLVSIYKQRNVDFEVIITDDGSKIKYREDLENWILKKGYKCIYNFLPQNVGTVKNILSAVELSKGKYIKTISPGDYFFDENSLFKYYKKISEGKYDLVYSDMIFYQDNKIVFKKNISHNKIMYNPKNLRDILCLYGGYFGGAAFVSTREIYLKFLTPLKDKVIYMEDRPLLYQLLIENFKFYGIQEPLIWYEYGTGISTKNKKGDSRLWKDTKECYDFLQKKYKDNKYVTKMIKRYNSFGFSKFKKVFYFLFNIPGYYSYLIKARFKGYLKNNASIEDMFEIIKE